MQQVKKYQSLFAIGLICIIVLFSCRKKDEKYEGTYIGTERYTEMDSGTSVNSLDTTYLQEIQVSYDKKIYTFLKLFDNPSNLIFTVDKKSIENHEYYPFGEIYYDGQGNEVGSAGYMKFSGDSMYLNSWSSFNGDVENLEFKGKRN